MTNPCFNCQKRHTLCWSECDDYKAWRKEYDAVREKAKQQKKEEYTELKRRRRRK